MSDGVMKFEERNNIIRIRERFDTQNSHMNPRRTM
jgi:hypothetical protein